mmetsp:Transcript_17449/g.21216  ORF Transcript_17449/g.21216 Transcript_17449/m.21216 type:complete len:102 (-) Transcript_17449:209-514(-)
MISLHYHYSNKNKKIKILPHLQQVLKLKKKGIARRIAAALTLYSPPKATSKSPNDPSPGEYRCPLSPKQIYGDDNYQRDGRPDFLIQNSSTSSIAALVHPE